MTSPKNRWICESQKTLLQSSFMELVEQNCRSSEDARAHRFWVLKSRNWCNIIPITADGKIVLIRQFRVGIADHTWEIPGGVVDDAEDVQAAAIREMTEETGYAPLPGARCEPLGWAFSNPAIIDNRCFAFIVGPVARQQDQKLDPGEMIEVDEVPIDMIPQKIISGELSHALILNTFLFLNLRSGGGRQGLTDQLHAFASAQNSK